MDNFFQRLHTYTVVPPPPSSKDLNEEIVLAVLSILSSATEEVTQGRASAFIPRIFPVMYLLIYLILNQKST